MGVSKKGGVDFFRGTRGFSESNFQLFIKYHIIFKKNIDYNYNHNHNVLYVLTIFKSLQLE